MILAIIVLFIITILGDALLYNHFNHLFKMQFDLTEQIISQLKNDREEE
jgi:hypothetical protein